TTYLHFFFLLLLSPPTSTLFPYTTLFRSSADGEGAALSEINPVRVEFENLLLAELLLQLDRNQHLHQFSLQSFFGRQEESPGERSEEHTSELQSPYDLVCRLLLEKKKKII